MGLKLLSSFDVKLEENSTKTEESDKDSEKDSVKEENKKGGSEKKEMRHLEKPVEVTGCRARKQVERLDVSYHVVPKEKIKFQKGRGRKLRDCPRIDHQIQKSSITVLQLLHRILFGGFGPVAKIKNKIRRFSGFPFVMESPEFDRKKANIDLRFSSTDLTETCKVLGLWPYGTRETLIMRILEFLLKPHGYRKKKKTKRKKTSVQTDEKPEEKEMAEKEETKKPSEGTKRKTDEEENESASFDDKPIAKKNKRPPVKELSEYEKKVQKNRDEKTAFLKSLKMNEIKSGLNETIRNLKPPKQPQKKGVLWPKHPVRKSVRLENEHFDFSEKALNILSSLHIEEEIKKANCEQ